MSREISWARLALIEQEYYLAPSRFESRPLAGQNRFFQRRVPAANIVGNDHSSGLKNGANLFVKIVEHAGSKFLGIHLILGTRSALLCLKQDEDRQVPRVRHRPIQNNSQAAGKRLTVASIIDILRVHHLESRLQKQPVWIKRRIGP